jgi:predicted nucleic acid-binding protein
MQDRPKSVFVDTWGWLALGHQRDQAHAQVKQLFKEIRTYQVPLYTSDYVLDELMTLLFKRESYSEAVSFMEGILAAQVQGALQIEWVSPERFEKAWEMRKRLQDKPQISFTDLSSMVIMTELKISSVLTDDRHFLQVGLGFELLPERGV